MSMRASFFVSLIVALIAYSAWGMLTPAQQGDFILAVCAVLLFIAALNAGKHPGRSMVFLGMIAAIAVISAKEEYEANPEIFEIDFPVFTAQQVREKYPDVIWVRPEGISIWPDCKKPLLSIDYEGGEELDEIWNPTVVSYRGPDHPEPLYFPNGIREEYRDYYVGDIHGYVLVFLLYDPACNTTLGIANWPRVDQWVAEGILVAPE